MRLKTCTSPTCDLPDKSVSEFHRCAANPDGLQRRCKVCRAAEAKTHNATHPGRNAANSRRYRAENPEANAASQRKYEEKNRDRISAYHRARYEEKRDEILVRTKTYRQANPAQYAEYSRRREALKRGAAAGDVNYSGLKARDKSCYLCGVDFLPNDVLHVDHKIPLSRVELSPSHDMDNCALTHATCNLRKGSRTPDEFWAVMREVVQYV